MTLSHRKCPICRRPRSADHAPFCSARCRDRDLANWFGDAYAVPGPPASEEDMISDTSKSAMDPKSDSKE